MLRWVASRSLPPAPFCLPFLVSAFHVLHKTDHEYLFCQCWSVSDLSKMESVNLDISLDTFSRANKRDPEVSAAERQRTKIISWILQLLQEMCGIKARQLHCSPHSPQLLNLSSGDSDSDLTVPVPWWNLMLFTVSFPPKMTSKLNWTVTLLDHLLFSPLVSYPLGPHHKICLVSQDKSHHHPQHFFVAIPK